MSSKTKSGNKGKKRIRVCYGCKTKYMSRKNNPSCPNCGRKHHTHHLWVGLLRQNRRMVQ